MYPARVSSTRLTITFQGKLTSQAQPVGPTSGITFAAEDNVGATTWSATGQDGVQTASWTVVQWKANNVAHVLGLQITSGPALRVRLTFEASAQAVSPIESSMLLTFPADDRLTLLEVAGSADEATSFEWLAAGSAAA